jgi:hypothetical protein
LRYIFIRNLLFLVALTFLLKSYLTNTILPVEYNWIVHVNILIHSLAAFYSVRNFSFQKVPIIFFVTCFNLYQYGIVLLLIPKDSFQLGIFNYEIMYILAVGFGVFYLTFFLFQFYILVNHRRLAPRPLLKYNDSRLRIILLFFFSISFFLKMPISGLDSIIVYLTIGAFFVGFIKRQNSLIENVIFFLLLIYVVILQLITGLIFAIVFFAVFLTAIFLIYGRGNSRGSVLMITMITFVGSFSILFSEVKFDYRVQAESLSSVEERVDLISDLILNRREEKLNYLSFENDIRETTAWRLSYSLSALSLVYSKTPSTINYWYGLSYFPILTKFVPRILWRNKPTEDMGQTFGHKYMILDEKDKTTSMNTPMIAESYMNFGFVGVILIMIVFSFLLVKVLSINNLKSDLSNNLLDNLVIAQFTVICIQTESNFSMLLGKIITLLLISVVLKSVLFGFSFDS